MVHLLEESNAGGNPLTPYEIYDNVLSKNLSYIKGMGYGPKS